MRGGKHRGVFYRHENRLRIDDPNTVYVLFAVTDMAKAKARTASPELKKLMTDAGVDGPPSINMYKLVK